MTNSLNLQPSVNPHVPCEGGLSQCDATGAFLLSVRLSGKLEQTHLCNVHATHRVRQLLSPTRHPQGSLSPFVTT